MFTCVYIEKEFFRTSWPISVKLDRNQHWVRRIRSYSTEDPGSSTRGDINRNVDHLDIFFSRTPEPE
jgi:hypothetical protein